MRKRILVSFLAFLLANTLLIQAAHSQSAVLRPDYLYLIQQKINSFLTYPTEALEKGWEGIVKVKFVLRRDGRVKEIYIAESSGYPLLDAKAMLTVKDASPYPFPDGYKDKKELEITLPINYINPSKSETSTTVSQEKYVRRPVKLESFSSQISSNLYPAGVLAQAPKATSPVAPLDLPTQMPKFSFPLQAREEPTQAPTISYQLPNVESLVETPGDVRNFVNLALSNNQPTQVAQEEIELAELKVAEAQRNFFPSLKVLGYNTSGEVYKVDYEEREMKVQLDQPFYSGGRLEDTYNQAKVNLEITRKNYDRLKLDVIHKTETSYYNLIAAKMHIQEKEALRQEAEEMLGKIEKLAEEGMIIPLEVASAKSWFEQIGFQIESIRQDLFMAELTFKQVLNVKEKPEIKLQQFDIKKLEGDLDSYIEIALENRPELYLSELLVKFNDYAHKIEESKNKKLAVNLISSYGYYEGHYKTEPWKSSNNWYGGFKASLPWEKSTINTSYTSEETKPRFGQTSPTASSTLSAEFNLLDNFKGLSDAKKTDIDLTRSLSDFNETAKTIAFEVQDAFLNYQKAILQLQTAQADMKFRRNEAEVTKIRSMVGEASLSSAMESLYNLSDAQTKYYQALANCQISLANLKKACGYGIQI
jgi:TonB family protein